MLSVQHTYGTFQLQNVVGLFRRSLYIGTELSLDVARRSTHQELVVTGFYHPRRSSLVKRCQVGSLYSQGYRSCFTRFQFLSFGICLQFLVGFVVGVSIGSLNIELSDFLASLLTGVLHIKLKSINTGLGLDGGVGISKGCI